MKFKTKWNEDLGIEIKKYTWEQFFTVCFKTVQENKLIWFQYRLIHRILGTQRLLYKMGIVQSELCLMCQSNTEILLQYTMRDQHFLPVNTIIMIVKSHIFSNSRQQKPFDNVHLKKYLRNKSYCQLTTRL